MTGRRAPEKAPLEPGAGHRLTTAVPVTPAGSPVRPFRAHWFTALSIVDTEASWKHEMTGSWEAL